jgi:NAD(P)-dependent dehydrogenase (short-subunit alcohol dehydrogenase family)
MCEVGGKVVLVTGATQNVGLGVARAFAGGGASVVVNSRDLARSEAVAKQLEQETGAATLGVAADVTDEADVAAMVGQVADRFGRLDVLVNNAGRTLFKPIDVQTLAEWDAVMDLTVRGSLLCIRACLPLLKTAGAEQRGGPSILFTSAINAARALDDYSAASASRGAINSLTIELAGELAAFGIRVNAVQIGPTGTPTGSDEMEGRPEEMAVIPLKRIGWPDDVGHAMVFLASERASYLTGVVLPLDGGLSAVLAGYGSFTHAASASASEEADA